MECQGSSAAHEVAICEDISVMSQGNSAAYMDATCMKIFLLCVNSAAHMAATHMKIIFSV